MLEYFKNFQKGTRTWQAIGNELGISARQARHFYDKYRNLQEEIDDYTPDSDNYEEVPIKHKPEIPEGFEVIGATLNGNGTVSYRLKKQTENIFDPYAMVHKILHSMTFTWPTVTPHLGTEIINISDVHVGMSTQGTPFDQEWHLTELYKRLKIVIGTTTSNVNLIINVLGDYADGERGKTASNTHKLHQNLTDAEIFEQGVLAMRFLIDNLFSKCKGTIHVNWVSNSNHPTVVDIQIARTLQFIYENSPVTINILDNVWNPVMILGIPCLLTHGKDRDFMKFGLPFNLTPDHKAKINRYAQSLGLESGDYVVLRGDQHQYGDKDYWEFRDIMVPSFAPPSGWAATNFLNPYPGGYVRAWVVNGNLRLELVTFK